MDLVLLLRSLLGRCLLVVVAVVLFVVVAVIAVVLLLFPVLIHLVLVVGGQDGLALPRPQVKLGHLLLPLLLF